MDNVDLVGFDLDDNADLDDHVDLDFVAIARLYVDYYDADLDVAAHDEDFDGDDDNWAGMDSSVVLEIGVGGHGSFAPILKMLGAF